MKSAEDLVESYKRKNIKERFTGSKEISVIYLSDSDSDEERNNETKKKIKEKKKQKKM